MAAALLLGACSSDEKGGADAGGGAAVAGAGERGGTTGGGGGAGGMGGATGGAGGGTCTQTSCSPNEYCDLTFNGCLAGRGTCRPRPMDCIVPEHEVCACDGHIYRSECEANGAGQDLADVGGCTPPTGAFACGPFFCAHGTESCHQTIGGAPMTIKGAYECRALPAACGTSPTCACLEGVDQCPTCTMSPSGDLTSTCLVL